MPLIHTIQAEGDAKIGIWHITEPEDFFKNRVAPEPAVHHPHKRLQYLAARYLLTELEPGFPIRAIKIEPSGKPYIPGGMFHFSLAHGGDYAVAIVCRDYRVGIDVEKITSRITRVAHKFLHPDELAFINGEHLYACLTLCWSAKEAVYKWYGAGEIGFRENIRLQPFSPAPAGQMSCRFQKDNQRACLHLDYLLRDDYEVTWLVDIPG